MANKIRGITVEIGGDTSGLNKALKDTNNSIKSTQSQLKDVEKLLKLDPSNTELLEQKQKLLGDAVAQTSEKLEILHKAEQELRDAGVDENSAQFMALNREIISTEADLQKCKKEADSFSVSLEKAKAATEKVGSAAKTVADKTKALSTAAAGLLGSLGGAALNAVKMSDDLNTLAKQSGLTTEEIQKFQYASDLVDVSTDDIIGSLKKLRKNMDSTSADTQEAWEKLGVAVKDADGNFRNSTDVFYETLEALSKIPNETERDIVAMQLFGKSADSLAGIVDDGGAALKALGDQAMASGAILGQDTLDSLNAVNDQIDTLKANAKGVLAQTGAKAMEALLPLFDSIIEKLGGLFEWIGNLDTAQINTIVTILGIVAAISPIASIIGGISNAVSGFLNFWPHVVSAGKAIGGFVAANPIAAIAVVVAALAVAVVKNWDKIKPVLEKAWAKVKEVFDNIKEKVEGVINTIKTIFKAAVNTIISIINKLIAGINKLIDGINKIKFNVPDWVPGIGGKSLGFNIKHIGTIPMLAKGGVLSSGSAIVGERGAELLTMAQGKAVVQPLDTSQITSALGDIKGLIGSGGTQTIIVQSVLDGRIIGETAYKYSQNRARAYAK